MTDDEEDRVERAIAAAEDRAIPYQPCASCATMRVRQAQAQTDLAVCKAENERLKEHDYPNPHLKIAEVEILKAEVAHLTAEMSRSEQAHIATCVEHTALKARHEQDIEAAFTEGWNYAKTSYMIADVSVALARYKAEQQQEGRDG